ncbi:TIGR03620 family F420-dependent LLM class oxidoreductase [Nonomuraea jiangxiensis]|uniref:Probable F420-dependent oxidoreductase, MSMEG_4141 family n=1 Tax=Nonomuraea jiangxiensis TaxID=633440 RepID=A0A1G9NBT2_9ACTN|nr:TIGR03620 family F420-dependent LLM class oxidoreductase [Nonomuraea jiangxiensis]SDL83355.1 probable F420-dependent oxidoreductase, MSMEG_4141 family [Nonomuraea jiangxiensis]
MDLGETRDRLGAFGVWIAPMTLLKTPVAVQREQFARIERLGYGSLWTGEPPATSPVSGREIFAQLSVVLGATRRLVAGAGIANVRSRLPLTMHAGAATLAEAHPGRLVLGLGGQPSERPITRLREYLDAMDEAAARVLPDIRYPRVLAALGPKAHELAAGRADGVHPFLQPVEHTGIARKTLGPGPLVIPHQALVLDTDPGTARGRMRAILRIGQRNVETPYTANYRRLGYGDADLADDRSDRLIDATLAWGEEDAVARRLRDHLDAGADHVLLHPLAGDLTATVDQLERLAPYLLPAQPGPA